jgi:hypothetical protein
METAALCSPDLGSQAPAGAVPKHIKPKSTIAYERIALARSPSELPRMWGAIVLDLLRGVPVVTTADRQTETDQIGTCIWKFEDLHMVRGEHPGVHRSALAFSLARMLNYVHGDW